MKRQINLRFGTLIFSAVAAIALLAFPLSPLTAQDELITKAYPVKDILLNVNQYVFGSVDLPGTEYAGGYGRFSGGGGGMQGGGGGGIFSIPDQLNHNIGWRQGLGSGGGFGMGGGGNGGFHFEEDTTVSLSNIGDTVLSLTESDERVDITKLSMQTFGNSTLIVTGDELVHELVHRHLKMLRSVASNTIRSVTVSATWLSLTDEEYRQLASEPKNGVVLADENALNALSEDQVDFGTITCFDGQTVHIVSGELRNRVQTVSPVVGSLENNKLRNSQVAEKNKQSVIQNAGLRSEPQEIQESGSSIGYKPITEMINEGAMLELTPIIVPDADSAIVNVISNITLPMNSKDDGVSFSNVITLDRQHVRSQQFRTSLRMPLAKPVIVGGSTIQVEGDASWYLVLEIHAGK